MEATAPTEVVTDLVFIFLGGTKLVHVLREGDTYEDRGNEIYLRWADTGEDAILLKTNLLQLGRRVRAVQQVEQTAVQKVVAEIKKAEARAQGAQGLAAAPPAAVPAPAAIPLPGVGTAVLADLWDRSPIKR
jgi:hypothetical protein